MKTVLKIRALAAGAAAMALLLVACGGDKAKEAKAEKPKAKTEETAAAAPEASAPVAEPVATQAPAAEAPAAEAPAVETRDLTFPADRSLGSLRTYDVQKVQWVTLGEAQGKVSVPKDAGITLIVTADGVKDLSALASLPADALRQIVLDELEVPDDQLAHLKNLKQLQKISFRAGHVTDAGVAHLGAIEGLMEIDLAMTPITDTAIKPLTALTQLDTLDLSATNVSDAAIPDITAITSLRTLDPQRSKITPEGVLQLIDARPELTIVER